MDEGVVSQSIDSFWGCELSSAKKCYEYEESQDTQEGVETLFEFRQACLGAKAKNGERNVVQLTTENIEGTSITHTILSMTLGSNDQVPMFLTVKPPVKLDLVQGSGPVHIVGSQVISLDDTSDEEEEDDDDEEVESPVKLEARRKATKRPADSPVQKAPKIAKLVEEEAEEGSEESEEEEEEMELALASKKGREISNKIKRPEEFVEANSDDDDEDEDDEDEEDEEDDESLDNDLPMLPDDDDSDDSEEEEEEEEVRPPKKVEKKVVLKTAMFAKPVSTKGSVKRGSKGDSERGVQEKTKSILKTPPVSGKGGRSTKSEGSGKKGSQAPLTIEEVKAKLVKSPNLPKKLEKFNNYVASSFKITDNNTKKKLWEFVQSSRK